MDWAPYFIAGALPVVIGAAFWAALILVVQITFAILENRRGD